MKSKSRSMVGIYIRKCLRWLNKCYVIVAFSVEDKCACVRVCKKQRLNVSILISKYHPH